MMFSLSPSRSWVNCTGYTDYDGCTPCPSSIEGVWVWLCVGVGVVVGGCMGGWVGGEWVGGIAVCGWVGVGEWGGEGNVKKTVTESERKEF